MNQLLNPNQTVRTTTSGTACVVEQFLGGGGQGEVYRAQLAGQPVALKWYYPHQATAAQRALLENLIHSGAPDPRFLWPLELTEADGVAGYGYVMPLREPRFRGMVDLMKRRIEPTFAALTIAGRDLAHGFLQLHAKGLCYRDISFGNVFFDPQTGEVLICDNDNVSAVGTEANIQGTPRFMAPEVVRGETRPNAATDLFSLAVLLFYMFMMHHPLEGKKESAIRCLDAPAMQKLYGEEPIFIFDPDNESNRPERGLHDNALIYWPIYPAFFQQLFVQTFTKGMHKPDERVRESIWREAMIRLHDALIYCPACGAENFYDAQRMQRTGGALAPCWQCGQPVSPPPRMRLGREVVMLNYNTRLYPHHIDTNRRFDFSHPVAEITRHPANPAIWGLKNVSAEKWVTIPVGGSAQDVLPGRTVTLVSGTRIQFGTIEGDIRV